MTSVEINEHGALAVSINPELSYMHHQFENSNDLAQFVAEYALRVPKSEQYVPCTGKRLSQMRLDQIKKTLIHMGVNCNKITSSENTIYIQGDDSEDIRKVSVGSVC